MHETVLAVAPETLDRVGVGVVWLGVVVAVAAVAVQLRRHGLDLCHGARPRASRLSPLMVFLPFAGFALASQLLVPVRGEVDEEAVATATGLIANSLAQAVGAALCLWVAARCFRHGARAFLLGVRPRRGELGRVILYLIAAGGLCEVVAVVTQRLFQLFDPEYAGDPHRVIQLLSDPATSPAAIAALWVGAAVVAPVAEECFFRGLLQTMVLRAVRRRWAAVLIPALLFGLAHPNQPHVVPALTLFGVILGVQYERSGALIGPITLHALFNLRSLVWQALGGG